MFKTCTKCNESKELKFFPKNKKYTLGVWCYCKKCVSDMGSSYYKENRDLKLFKIKQTEIDKYTYVEQIKSKPCADCKIQYHLSAMEFDHLPGCKKLFNIGSGLRKYGLEKLKQEIAKCEVVCSNCHHVRSFNRQTNK